MAPHGGEVSSEATDPYTGRPAFGKSSGLWKEFWMKETPVVFLPGQGVSDVSIALVAFPALDRLKGKTPSGHGHERCLWAELWLLFLFQRSLWQPNLKAQQAGLPGFLPPHVEEQSKLCGD